MLIDGASERSRRIGILGAGAVGGYMAGHLVRAGFDVEIIDGWGAHVQRINDAGLTIEDISETFSVKVNANTFATRNYRELPDVVILACKIHELDRAIETLEGKEGFAGTYIATLNGLVDLELAEKVGRDRVIGCIVSGLHTELASPGHIRRHVSRFSGKPVFRLGNVGAAADGTVREWSVICENIDTSAPVDDLERERWTKLQYNSITAAVSAVSGLPIRSLCLDEGWRAIMIEVGKEVASVAKMHGVELGEICGVPPELWNCDDSAGELLRDKLVRYGESMEPSAMSGVAYDLFRGRPTEVNALNGAVIARAEKVGIAVPRNIRLRDILLEMESEGSTSSKDPSALL